MLYIPEKLKSNAILKKIIYNAFMLKNYTFVDTSKMTVRFERITSRIKSSKSSLS